MEKIKKALDQARQERNRRLAASNAVSDAAPAEIVYTTTQTVNSSEALMREHRLISSMPPNEYTEAIKMLSTQVLQRMEENHWSSIALTSPRRGMGSTTLAINMGLSIAREVEYTVLLVDANLRKPSVHRYFGIEPDHGLSDYLNGDIELASALVNPRGISHFVILPGGTPTIMSAELLKSPKMCSLVEELTTRYPKRIIIFDLPAVLETADTLSFMPCVDAALLVVEDDETREADLESAVDMLSVTNVIGTVLNKSST